MITNNVNRILVTSTGKIFKSKFNIAAVLNEKMPSYEEAIQTLNKLQSNKLYIQNANNYVDSTKLSLVRKYLIRSGLTLEQLHQLPVLHVTGTKGKGSTCAYSESILRHHGYKTGFYSSPHLIEVRERIRINGVPISRNEFAETFMNIYNTLNSSKENEEDMPLYFRFLTIMAFHVFLRHKVDVAIIEVGIGGEYDCTNIVTNVPVAGITSIGYDHTSLLGKTLDSIAWNKSGIMKRDSLVFTVPQFEEASKVLHERSKEKLCVLKEIKNKQPTLNFLQDYPWSLQTNINLAIELAKAWMSVSKQSNNNTSLKSDVLKDAIKNCVWPGRYDVRQLENVRYFIDGAHTFESFTLCCEWFVNSIKTGKRGLIFNLTGDRSGQEFVNLFSEYNFDTICFVPNITRAKQSNDIVDLKSTMNEQIAKCNKFKEMWEKRKRPEYEEVPNEPDVLVFPSVNDAMEHFENKGKYNVLVTGSLHLAGAILSVLDPELNGTLKD